MENNSDSQVCSTQWKTGDKRSKMEPTEAKNFISYLPYEIIIHIISLLPLEALVLVSLVSRQWETLVKNFLSMKPSSLNLDEMKMSTGTINPHGSILRFELATYPLMNQIGIQSSIIAGSKKFNDFVNRTLYLHKGCTMKKVFFNLCYDGLQNSRKKVDQWFHFAITNEVKELDVNFLNGKLIGLSCLSKAYEFPYIQTTSKSLECLKLNFCKFMKSNLESFCYLQTLVLKYVKAVGFSIEDLENKCCNLKDLTIDLCYIPLDFMVCRRKSVFV